jgi:DNA mismatch repair protein PMS2
MQCYLRRFLLLNAYYLSAKTKVLTTSGNNDVRDNIANIFGAKILTQIIPLNINVNIKRSMRSQKNEYDDER